ncbi:MAG: hypothetical protein SF123_00775 [Chloroflexota bacterium]|nr:hypothetical protein [Chloroflexota bacterium]
MDNTALLIGVAGFAMICAGLLFVALLIVLRITGRTAWSFLGVLLRGGMGEDPDSQPTYVPQQRQSLKTIAESVDFDTAVARNLVEQEEFNQPGTGNTQSDDTFSPPAMPALNRAQSLRPANPRRRNSPDYDNDEIFGGLLDTDGDGSPDH